MSLTSTPRPTWDDLVAREPRLAKLRARCQAIKDPGGRSFCQHRIWWKGYEDFASLKRQMNQLVGIDSTHADRLMHTSEAWEVARDALLAALPECRDCPCFIDISDGADASFVLG